MPRTARIAVRTLDVIIDELAAVREEKRAQNQVLKDISERERSLEQEAMGTLSELGLEKATASGRTLFLTRNTVGSISDPEKFWRYVAQKKAYHLVQNRVSNPALREEIELRKGKPIPGTQTYEVTNVNLRSASS